SVRMARSSDEDARNALCWWFSRSVKELEAVQILEVETDHSERAVYFESVSVLIADSITRSFEAADTAIAEARLKQDGIIHLASSGEGVRYAAELGDRAVQQHCC